MPREQENPQHRTVAKEAVQLGKSVSESRTGGMEPGPGRMWHLYVLQCADRSLYCGIALDVQKRLAQHQKGRGARYTRARLPVLLLNSTAISSNVAEALRAERRFKALPRAKKLKSLKSSLALPE